MRLDKGTVSKYIFVPQNKYNNNSIRFFITYVPSQQPQGQLQASTGENTIMQKSRQKTNDNNSNNNNFININLSVIKN
jgi:hypothetical protein